MSDPMDTGVGQESKRKRQSEKKAKKSKSTTETAKVIITDEATGEKRIRYIDTGALGGPEFYAEGGERIVALPNVAGPAPPDVMIDVAPEVRVPEQHRLETDGPVVDYSTPGKQVVVVSAGGGKAPRANPYGPARPRPRRNPIRLEDEIDKAAQAEAQVVALRRELFELRARHPEDMDVDSPTPGEHRRLKGGYLTPEQARRRAAKQRQRRRLPWEGRKYISSKARSYRRPQRYERRF